MSTQYGLQANTLLFHFKHGIDIFLVMHKHSHLFNFFFFQICITLEIRTSVFLGGMLQGFHLFSIIFLK